MQAGEYNLTFPPSPSGGGKEFSSGKRIQTKKERKKRKKREKGKKGEKRERKKRKKKGKRKVKKGGKGRKTILKEEET